MNFNSGCVDGSLKILLDSWLRWWFLKKNMESRNLGKMWFPSWLRPCFFKREKTTTKLGHASLVQISGVGFLPIFVIQAERRIKHQPYKSWLTETENGSMEHKDDLPFGGDWRPLHHSLTIWRLIPRARKVVGRTSNVHRSSVFPYDWQNSLSHSVSRSQLSAPAQWRFSSAARSTFPPQSVFFPYHSFRQLWQVLGVKLMKINSNLFSRYSDFFEKKRIEHVTECTILPTV